jgi:hypothetical protein
VILSFFGTAVTQLPLAWLQRTLIRWEGLKRAGRNAALVVSGIFTAVVMLAYIAYMGSSGMWVAGAVTAAASVFLSVTSVYIRKRTKRGSELLDGCLA